MPLDELIARDGWTSLAMVAISKMSKSVIPSTDCLIEVTSDLFYNKDLFDSFGVPYPTNDEDLGGIRRDSQASHIRRGCLKDIRNLHSYLASTYFMYGLQKHMGDLVEGPYEMLKDGLEMARRIQ